MLDEMRTAKEKVHIRIIGSEVWLWVTILLALLLGTLDSVLRISRVLFSGFTVANSTNWVL